MTDAIPTKKITIIEDDGFGNVITTTIPLASDIQYDLINEGPPSFREGLDYPMRNATKIAFSCRPLRDEITNSYYTVEEYN